MARHRLFLEVPLASLQDDVAITGTEAAHALLVKRVEIGEGVELRDGQGGTADAVVTGIDRSKRDVRIGLQVRARAVVVPVEPAIHVYSSVPKGDRSAQLIDQLSQAGATSWRWLRTSRAVAEASEHKRERLNRVAVESCKQSGRAWLLMIEEPTDIAGLTAWAAQTRPAHPRTLLLADARGLAPATWAAGLGRASGPSAPPGGIGLIVGPEGGLDPAEHDKIIAAGAVPLSFGPHVMRTETAAVVAVGVLRSLISKAGVA
jgi:16S rRNA (uracil1498-N3)-methyltransferase